MNTVKFSSGGGPVVASVSISPQRDGSYELRLWEREANGFVAPSPWHGNFTNLDDDAYSLPRPNSDNDGRLLQCLAVAVVPAGAKPAALSLTVSQDGTELGRETRTVLPGTSDQFLSLWLMLKKGA